NYMCGIVAYIGDREAYPILIKGLKRLEYRGYDSAGVALLDQDELRVYKKKGKVSDLEAHAQDKNREGNIGIGHTRWATHGAPTDANAHPHTSNDGRLAIIHNGIIENYASLKKELISKGHTFQSETDTEVLGHFIEEIRKSNQCSLEEAVRIALKRVVGAYVIVIASKDNPDTLIAARKGSPLVIGVGKDRKSTRLNSSHVKNSYAVFCLKKKSSPALPRRRLAARSTRPCRRVLLRAGPPVAPVGDVVLRCGVSAPPAAEIHALSLHDALPICTDRAEEGSGRVRDRDRFERQSRHTHCSPQGKSAGHRRRK